MLQLNQIHKQIADTVIFHELSISIEPGAKVAVVGPSGVGKTTMFRMIAGLDKPDAGSISCNGEIFVDNKAWLAPWKRKIGFVFQDLALWPHLTVYEHLEFALKEHANKSERKHKIESLLAQLHMNQYLHRYPSELSGGQQQRLAIARALAVDPEILLLDEAFSNLDPLLKEELWQYLDMMQQNSRWTLMYITHDVKQALLESDQIILLQNHTAQNLTKENIQTLLMEETDQLNQAITSMMHQINEA